MELSVHWVVTKKMDDVNVKSMLKDENVTLFNLVFAFQLFTNINSKPKTLSWKMVKKFDMVLTNINSLIIPCVAMLNYPTFR